MSREPGALRLFLFLLLTYAQYFQNASWGSASRFDLARAIAEKGTIRIDAYHENTGDKAIANGHTYTDKAPLPSFLAVPGVLLAHAIRKATGLPASESVFLSLMGGLAAIFASGIVTAAGGVIFYRMLIESQVERGTAWLASVLTFLATPLFPYATLLQGHAPAAAWLLAVFFCWFPANGIPSFRRVAYGGVAASAALATEYLTAIPLSFFALAALLRRAPQDAPSPRVQRALAMAAGALPGMVLLGIYHQAAFGSPWSLGYQRVALPYFQEKMSTGFLGVHAPDFKIALRLLIEPYRGLFPSSPLLLLAFPGLFLLLREKGERLRSFASLFTFIYYWVLTAGHATWHGGWAIGPRHLIASIPLLGRGIVPALESWPRPTMLAGIISVFIMLAATAVGPEVPEDIVNPYSNHILPHFFSGDFSIGEQGFGELYPARIDREVPDRWDAFLLGEALRLPRHFALVPIFLVWAALWPWGSGPWYKRSETS
jgi:hypothetical protein